MAQKQKRGPKPHLQPSEFHTCLKCKKTKAAAEFYKCAARPTGKQPNCKDCNREEGVFFRQVLRPEFYWSEDGTGYFEKDYQKTLDYYADYMKADKIPFVYSIETPSGLYIGCSRTRLIVRKSRHKIDYMRHVRGQKGSSLPGLHKAFDKEGANWIQALETMKALETFPKGFTQSELLTRERGYIKKYERQGITLLNIVGTKNDIRVRKPKP